jgi:hypothetical protein
MRTLLWTLLLAAPLLAQEAEEKKPAEPTKQDKAAEIRKLVETFLDGKDEEKLEELEKRLRALLMDDLFKLEIMPERVVFGGGTGGVEIMSGSSDGTSYTMKSLGRGRYELAATQKTKDGETRKITDEGTLTELRKKYPFLKGIFAVRVPFSEVTVVKTPRSAPGFLVRERPRTSLGMRVRPPSESLAHHLELPTGAGLVVDSVLKNSRAEKLGLKKHDVLLRIDGELIDSPDQLEKLEKNKGTLGYVRRAKTCELDLSMVGIEVK